MKKLMKTTALVLLPFFLASTIAVLFAPTAAFADIDKVTKVSPQTMESDPMPETTVSEGSSWWKWALGVLVVGGIAAAAGGHGGGGGSSSGGSSNNGTLNVGW
jgi:hypothetical protein